MHLRRAASSAAMAVTIDIVRQEARLIVESAAEEFTKHRDAIAVQRQAIEAVHKQLMDLSNVFRTEVETAKRDVQNIHTEIQGVQSQNRDIVAHLEKERDRITKTMDDTHTDIATKMQGWCDDREKKSAMGSTSRGWRPWCRRYAGLDMRRAQLQQQEERPGAQEGTTGGS